MDKIAHLIFEINNTCNMAGRHPDCPINSMNRYGNLSKSKRLTNKIIVETCENIFGRGFDGYVAFHYYNEPMIEIDKITRLIGEIKGVKPSAKFLLWTNGTLIDETNVDKLAVFNKIVITNYQNRDFGFVRQVCENVVVNFWGFDDRAENSDKPDKKFCVRPYNELIFDYHGHAHICCIDFRGEVELGNLFFDDLDEIIEKYQSAREKCQGDLENMSPDAPLFCQHCSLKHQTTLGRL